MFHKKSKKKSTPSQKPTIEEQPLKIDKTFDEAMKAIMVAANKKVKKSA